MELLPEETLEEGSEGQEVTLVIGSFFAALHLAFWISAEIHKDVNDCKASLFTALLAIIFFLTYIWSLSS
jgi:uncharacterized protein YqhQ